MKVYKIKEKPELAVHQDYPVAFRSYLYRTSSTFDLVKSTHKDNEGLAYLLANSDVRKQIRDAIENEISIAKIIKTACGSSNDSIKINGQLTTFSILETSVRKHMSNLSRKSKLALTLILNRALNSWGLLYTIDDIIHVEKKNLSLELDAIEEAISLESTLLAVNEISFQEITDRPLVSTAFLAVCFREGLTKFINRLRIVDQLSLALNSTLTRVKAVHLKKLDGLYDVDELAFLTDSNFQMLSSNFDIVMRAMSQTTDKPLSHCLLWGQHDALVADAIRASKIFGLVSDYREVISSYPIYSVIGANGSIAGVVLCADIRFKGDVGNYIKYSRGVASEFAKLTEILPIDTAISKWLNSVSMTQIGREYHSILSMHVSGKISPRIITLGLDNDDLCLMKLASCLCDQTYINENGQLSYMVNLPKNMFSVEYDMRNAIYVTNEAEHVILQMTQEKEASKTTEIKSIDELKPKTKYINDAEFIIKESHNKATSKVIVSMGDVSASVAIPKSFTEFLNIEVSKSAYIVGNSDIVVLIDELLSMAVNISDILSEWVVDQKTKALVVANIYSKIFERYLSHLTENQAIRAYFASYKYKVITAIQSSNNIDILKTMRSSSLWKDRVIEDQIKYQCILSLLESYGVITDDLLSKDIKNVISSIHFMAIGRSQK